MRRAWETLRKPSRIPNSAPQCGHQTGESQHASETARGGRAGGQTESIMSPTGLTMRLLRGAGFTVDVCERSIPHQDIRRDLFHVADVFAIRPRDRSILLVQCTSLSNVSSRVTKARSRPEMSAILATGIGFQVWGWFKSGAVEGSPCRDSPRQPGADGPGATTAPRWQGASASRAVLVSCSASQRGRRQSFSASQPRGGPTPGGAAGLATPPALPPPGDSHRGRRWFAWVCSRKPRERRLPQKAVPRRHGRFPRRTACSETTTRSWC